LNTNQLKNVELHVAAKTIDTRLCSDAEWRG